MDTLLLPLVEDTGDSEGLERRGKEQSLRREKTTLTQLQNLD